MTAHLQSAARAFEAALPDPLTNRNIARMFHEAYERLAPEFGYRTREASAVPWEKVPAKNRDLMTATVGKVRSALAAALPDERLREALTRANDDLVLIADEAPEDIGESIDSVRAAIKDALAAADREKPEER